MWTQFFHSNIFNILKHLPRAYRICQSTNHQVPVGTPQKSQQLQRDILSLFPWMWYCTHTFLFGPFQMSNNGSTAASPIIPKPLGSNLTHMETLPNLLMAIWFNISKQIPISGTVGFFEPLGLQKHYLLLIGHYVCLKPRKLLFKLI